MRSRTLSITLAGSFAMALAPSVLEAQADPRLEDLKGEVVEMVESRAKQVQEIVDMLFSFGELGFQEFETQRYLTGILEEAGFEIEFMRDFNRFAAPSWWWNGKVLRRRSFGRIQLKLFDLCVPLLRRVDPWLPWPGLGLLAVASRPADPCKAPLARCDHLNA